MKHQQTIDLCDPLLSQALGCQHPSPSAIQAIKHTFLGAIPPVIQAIKQPFLVLKEVVHTINFATQANKHILLGAQGSSPHSQLTGLELRTKLINTPFLVPKEVVHILNCAFAHEAPSNSSICDPSRTHVLGCQHWTRAATQSDKHTFLGAQLDHTTRGCGANLLSVSKIPMDKLTDSPAVVEAIEIRTSDWRSLLSISDFKARLGVKKSNELLDF
ncbi:hypothetical protein KY289_003182 [Solanum tuberosum]|nr:hypothetical protein KY289_003182 [Solanum tuberosum]